MTDRAAPKAKTTKGKKAAKKPTGPKLVASNVKPGVGHNSNGEVVPGFVNLVDELLAINAQKKALGEAERTLRNKAKSEFGVLSGVLAHEMRLRKMDSDVRVQFESNHQDVKKMLGYQPELDFVGGTPTKASVAVQPTEAELAARNGDKKFTVDDADPTPVPAQQAPASQEAEVQPQQPAGEGVPAIPQFLQRVPAPAPKSVVIGTGNVIRREG